MKSFQSSTWADVDAIRERITKQGAKSLEDAAQALAADLAQSCPTIVLARVFVVLPMAKLSASDRRFAAALVDDAPALNDGTPALVLLGTAGSRQAWRDRMQSRGHRAIPLLGAAFVRNIPMIAKLLADLDVGLAGLDDGKTLDTRRLLGGRNAAFYVEDARRTQDVEGRQVIPNKEFVDANGVRTVFGMGGAYLDGTLTVAVVFTSETFDRLIVDRFPSLISNFKMTTRTLLEGGRIYGASSKNP